MTFVFLFILVLNCLVIFTADALLGTVAPTQTITKVIVLNSTTVPSLPSSLVQNGQLALGQPENNLYAADDSFGGNSNGTERKSKVVGRKGVSEDLGSSSIVGTSESSTTSNRPSLPLAIVSSTIDKAPINAATTPVSSASPQQSTSSSTTKSTPPNPRADSSRPSAPISPADATSLNDTKPVVEPNPETVKPVPGIIGPNVSTTVAPTSSTTTTLKPSPPITPKPTPKPTKPKTTHSVDDDPNRVDLPHTPLRSSNTDTQSLDDDGPYSQPSREFPIPMDSDTNTGRMYVMPLVTLIFAIPMVLTLGIVATRRFKAYWSTRHYRRMDFLVDGMYNT